MNSIKLEMEKLPADPEALRFHLKLVEAAAMATAPWAPPWYKPKRESIAVKLPGYTLLNLRDRAPAARTIVR